MPRSLTRCLLGLAAAILLVAGASLQRSGLPSQLASTLGAAAADLPTSPFYYVATRERVMGLTFDISWGSRSAGDVLEVLRDHGQRATFFLSGPWSLQHPEIVSAIARNGHEIASHGQAHVNLSQRSEGEIGKNLDDAADILVRLTGQTPRFFRPPNGDFDARVVRIAAARGEETVIWSIDSLDWIKRDPREIAERVVAGAFPGAVILFHASDSAPATADALPMVFRSLAAMGYRLVPLGDLLSHGDPVREDPRGRPQKPNMAAAGR